MTDEQIIKALECCTYAKGEMCNECPYVLGVYSCDNEQLHKDALDLINRQKAEIKRLKNEIFKWSVQCDAIGDCMNEAVAGARAEAIKEFAERLKKDLFYNCGDINYSETCDTRRLIDNLVKEMVGESDV